jgi:hypothetical protein
VSFFGIFLIIEE